MATITVKFSGLVQTFTGEPQLRRPNITDTYFVSMPDPTSPSGRSVVWQQRVANGVAEACTIETSGFPYDPFEMA